MNLRIPACIPVITLLAMATTTGTAEAQLRWNAERDGRVIEVLAGIEQAGDLAPALMDAVDRADLVVFETEMDPAQRQIERRRVADAARYPKGDNLLNHLPAETIARFNALCKRNGIDNTGMVRVRPWAAAYNLNRVTLSRTGIDLDATLEHRLYRRAVDGGKPVDYLSKPDEIIGFFGALPSDIQAALFAKRLADAESLDQIMRERTAAWSAGDADAAASLIDRTFQGHDKVWTEVIARRNGLWADKLEGMIRFDDRILVVAPLESLPGANGLLDQLRARGFAITPEGP